MKALLVALFLILSTGLAAAAGLPTKPPPFEPAPIPTIVLPTPPGLPPDLQRMLRLLGDDDEDSAAPSQSCPKGGECVLPYRFSEPVTRGSVKKLESFLASAVKAGADMVMLEITTPGGDYDAGHEAARLIENSAAFVVCVADERVASMGFYILQSCDRRLMTERTVLMAHQVAAMTPDMSMNLFEIEQVSNRLRALEFAYAAHCTRQMKITRAEFQARVTGGKQWWLNAQEALRYGAVDAVVKQNPNEVLKDLRAGKRP